MNENQNPIEIIQVLPKYVQALYSDSVLYFSGEKGISTEARKAIVLSNIALIKEQITAIEKSLE